MAQRMKACVACHGPEGRSTNSGYLPRIAGKPAGYLYNQLINFREGKRHNAPMAYLLDHLSDAYLHEIASYFAALDLPYPPPQTTDALPAMLVRGQQLVRHGDAALGVPAWRSTVVAGAADKACEIVGAGVCQHARAHRAGHHDREVDDDEAAQVAQAHLARHFVGGFQVGAGGGFLDVAASRGARRTGRPRVHRAAADRRGPCPSARS